MWIIEKLKEENNEQEEEKDNENRWFYMEIDLRKIFYIILIKFGEQLIIKNVYGNFYMSKLKFLIIY